MTLRCAIIFLALVLSGAVAAQEMKIGFVDIPFLIDEAPQAQAASIRLEREFAPRQELIKEQKAELEILREELEDDSLDSAALHRSETEYRQIRFSFPELRPHR